MEILHLVERHLFSEEEKERLTPVWLNWAFFYETCAFRPVHVWSLPRDSSLVGCTRHLFYLRDMLDYGMRLAGPTDIIMLTNDDVAFHPAIVGEIKRHCAVYGGGCARRVDWDIPISSIVEMPVRDVIAQGTPGVGRDVFFFTYKWLKRAMPHIPDVLIGTGEWDNIMCAVIRKLNNVPVGFPWCDREAAAQDVPGSEIPTGLVVHRLHVPLWKKDDPSAQYNMGVLARLRAAGVLK